MPWLHLIFEAWEDYKKKREQEAVEREQMEAQEREAMKVFEDAEAGGHGSISFGDDDRDHKKKKKDNGIQRNADHSLGSRHYSHRFSSSYGPYHWWS